ncbi:hypothetical protein [Ideonella sp. A 288]|uniref:hypothetical protein n=1 Tax=Ideonella sp. A 288 TaxID=1962181 RepID=UPI000B4A7962|nr:hypothetical protein [Ideonella sp. A 288]
MKWFRAWLERRRPKVLSERQRALDLIAAVDAGGVPLNPARVNDIARQLGLEVSTRARVEDTIERIRAALARQPTP